jgi:hypothetical protein
MIKKILYFLLIVLVAIQFFHPAKNQSAVASPNDIAAHYTIPDNVLGVLKKSCYDCHSNNTVYPWYNNIQPVAWWLANHIQDAKKELNFSEFNSYKPKRKIRKLKEVTEQLEKGEMPLNTYLWIHSGAKLSGEQIKAVSDWAKALQIQIAADSARTVLLEKQEHSDKEENRK